MGNLQNWLFAISIIIMFGLFKNFTSQRDEQELREAIDKETFLVDVRTPGEFSSGSAKGAVNIPLDKVAGQLAKFKGKKNIVVFCRSGTRSGQAKRILEQNGYKNVINGGTWQNVNKIITEN